MSIDWAAFGQVALVSLAFGVGIVVVFSLGLLGLSYAEGRAGDGAPSEPGRWAGAVLAGICLLACLAAVLLGIVLVVPQLG